MPRKKPTESGSTNTISLPPWGIHIDPWPRPTEPGKKIPWPTPHSDPGPKRPTKPKK